MTENISNGFNYILTSLNNRLRGRVNHLLFFFFLRKKHLLYEETQILNLRWALLFIVTTTGPFLFVLLILFFNIRVYYTSYNEQEVIVDEKDI